MILASTKPTVLTTNLEYRYNIIISISNSENHDQDIETLHFNPKTLKLKQNEVILSKPQSTLNHITFQPIWLSRACLTIVTSQSLPPPLSILRLKPNTSLPEISQLDEGIHSFPIQCFEQRRRLCLHISKQLKLEWNFNTLIC